MQNLQEGDMIRREVGGTRTLAQRLSEPGSDNVVNVTVAFESAVVTITPDLQSLAINGTTVLSIAVLAEASGAFAEVNGLATFAAQVISIGLVRHDGEVTELPRPLLFSLETNYTNNELKENEVLRCVFWDVASEDWSSKGVRTLGVVNGTVSCSTTHLSIFTVIVSLANEL